MKIKKRFYIPYKKNSRYKRPIFLTNEHLIRDSINKGMSDLTSQDAQRSRDRMAMADLIIYTNERGETKKLKDRFGYE